MALTPVLAATGEDGPDQAGLAALSADAAARARALLVGEPVDPVHRLQVWPDAVRLAAVTGDDRLGYRLGEAAGRGGQLARAVAAWRWGGQAGLETLENAWTPPPAVQVRGHRALELAWSDAGREGPAPVTTWRNRWTIDEHGLQLRYGRDGRWHPYRRQDSAWWPSGPSEGEADTAFAELLREPG